MSFLKSHSSFYDLSFNSLETPTFTGLKSTFTKSFPNFSFTSTYLLNKSEFLQFNSKFIKNNFIFQNIFDSQNNFQNKLCLQFRKINLRINKVSTPTGSFSQAEVLFPMFKSNCAIKLIKPAIKEVKNIIGINSLIKIKEYFLGAEVLFSNKELGINFGIKNRGVSLNVQQLTLISANYSGMLGNLSYILDLNYNLISKETNKSIFLQLQSNKSILNCSLDSNLQLKTTIEEKLNDNLSVSFSGECDLSRNAVEVGLGINLDF